jgi:hypothetical protein
MFECDKEQIICEPKDNSTCLNCAGVDNYNCIKNDKGVYACGKTEKKINHLLEEAVYKDGKIVYVCKYPNFANHSIETEPCGNLSGCLPTGELKKTGSNETIYNLSDVTDFSQVRCECGTFGISRYTELGFPECTTSLIGDLLDNPEPYGKHCVGFPGFGGECYCPSNHVSNKDVNELTNVGYRSSTAYDLSLLPNTCVKKPCKFDPFTYREFDETQARWSETEKSCICDESQGITGIYINEAGNGNAVDTNKYNACISLSKFVAETTLYTTFYVPPKGDPLTWFKCWSPNKAMLPNMLSLGGKGDTYVNFNGLPSTIKFQYPLDNTLKKSIFTKRKIDFDKEDSVLKIVKKDEYDSKLFKEGDIIRNVNSVEGRHYPTLITDKDTVAIYEHSLLLNDDELVNVPQIKK